MRTPADLLADLVASDPGRPRITQYDDTPDGGGERVELSARVLANWVAKAGNALQEEWDAAPGSRVRLALPPHWRAAYWAMATWSVGATVTVGSATDPDVIVSDDPVTVAAAARADGVPVLVTLPALARAATAQVPAGTMDEARELATYADQLAAWAEPSEDDAALDGDGDGDGHGEGGRTPYGTLLGGQPLDPGSRVHTSTTDLAGFLRTCLAAWSADGSVVLSRGDLDDERRARRLEAEGVTLDLG